MDTRFRELERLAGPGDVEAHRQVETTCRRGGGVVHALRTDRGLLCWGCRPGDLAVVVARSRRGRRTHVVLPHSLIEGQQPTARCVVELQSSFEWGEPTCRRCRNGLEGLWTRLAEVQQRARTLAQVRPCCSVRVCVRANPGEPCWGDLRAHVRAPRDLEGLAPEDVHVCAGHTVAAYCLPFQEWVRHVPHESVVVSLTEQDRDRGFGLVFVRGFHACYDGEAEPFEAGVCWKCGYGNEQCHHRLCRSCHPPHPLDMPNDARTADPDAAPMGGSFCNPPAHEREGEGCDDDLESSDRSDRLPDLAGGHLEQE
jgi:hypothetical protein